LSDGFRQGKVTRMPLAIKRFDVRQFSAAKMEKVNLFETPRFFCDVYCLAPGQSQKPHSHAASDKLYAVLEGEVRVSVDDEHGVLGVGDVVLCPAGSDHGLDNLGPAEARVLVFMAPHPRL
jgi:quercetin dioxygenase-like cupin family protein